MRRPAIAGALGAADEEHPRLAIEDDGHRGAARREPAQRGRRRARGEAPGERREVHAPRVTRVPSWAMWRAL